jgi:glutamyl-tRNA synthetase
LIPEGARRLGLLIERLERVGEFTPAAIEGVVRELTTELGLKLVDLAQLARLAVTGRTASPPIFDVLALLGRAESLARLSRAREVAEGAA